MTRTKEEKEAIVQLFLSQSISKTAFCKENNISQPTLNRLLKQFNSTDKDISKPELQFMKIFLPAIAHDIDATPGIYLELSGMILRFPQNISATFIGEVLKVVMSQNV